MRIAVFEATGGTGREVVRQALGAGHEVTVMVRKAGAAFSDGNLIYTSSWANLVSRTSSRGWSPVRMP